MICFLLLRFSRPSPRSQLFSFFWTIFCCYTWHRVSSGLFFLRDCELSEKRVCFMFISLPPASSTVPGSVCCVEVILGHCSPPERVEWHVDSAVAAGLNSEPHEREWLHRCQWIVNSEARLLLQSHLADRKVREGTSSVPWLRHLGMWWREEEKWNFM